MLEGLMHSYIEAFNGGWQPRDSYIRPARDSKSRRRSLLSLSNMRGKRHEGAPDTCSCDAGGWT